MVESIKDGTGTGKLVKVDSENRLRTRAVSEAENLTSNLAGNGYNINTGIITLSNAADTPVLYIKNNETGNLIIDAIIVGIASSTGGDSGEMIKITFIRNPTAGTIITSTPTNVDINGNRNFGSNNSLTVDAYKGATGDTMTDGDDHILVYASASSRNVIPIAEVLTKGTAFGLKIDPQTSNTSMNIYAACVCHLEN